MDTVTLVKLGHTLLRYLDKAGVLTVFSAWMYNKEVDIWKLWVVPKIANNSKTKITKESFYLTMSKIISENRNELDGLDIGMISYRPIRDAVVEMIGRQFRSPGFANVRIVDCSFNGFLVEECIIIRSEL